MPNPFTSLSAYGATWSAKRRILIIAVVITALLAVAGIAAWFTGNGGARHEGSTAPSVTDSTAPSADPTPTATSSGTGSVPKPPRISDPLAYAKAAALMLWSYDTRTTSRDQELAGMNAWMTTETKYADWSSVTGQVPDPVLWSRMRDNAQHARAKVTDTHYPSAFKQALADDPSAITEAYIYYVTATGTQQIAWKKGGSGAEDRAVTLAVQCRPSHDCSLVAIAPSVAP
ncbi:hypothetical protein FB563_4059 [Streptomyces puniciscabiei]|uniref:Uncharacterized protein n=1 Tax=Streptomyces puniciscabiei TaxID=164348 RepID=A0A542UIW1_9ACTN|nr:hypothetical protein [Streptomyces puniciscabiei]TQK99006.1 hypothetical protein FB563_4059 [Streptomyces puniciscabiei]